MSDSAASASNDELRVARAVSYGLPLVTIVTAAALGIVIGPATSILALAAGLLLGVIAILWASLRILSGDAPLTPELEALEMATHGVDALATRKKMLLRALKDLEAERRIGKIDDDDFDQLASVYRAELKSVYKRIDDSLAPHRAKAEALAKEHLAKAGVASAAAPKDEESSPEPVVDRRVKCPECKASNEPDAKFCKECAAKLAVVE